LNTDTDEFDFPVRVTQVAAHLHDNPLNNNITDSPGANQLVTAQVPVQNVGNNNPGQPKPPFEFRKVGESEPDGYAPALQIPKFDLFLACLGFALSLFDWGSDIWMSSSHFRRGNNLEGSLTIGIVICAGILSFLHYKCIGYLSILILSFIILYTILAITYKS